MIIYQGTIVYIFLFVDFEIVTELTFDWIFREIFIQVVSDGSKPWQLNDICNMLKLFVMENYFTA